MDFVINVHREIAAHFLPHTKAKATPEIRVEDWSMEIDWFTVSLYLVSWDEEIPCYKRRFLPWVFEDYCQSLYTMRDFSEWWDGLLIGTQRIITEDFIKTQLPALISELYTYHSTLVLD